MTSFNVFDEAPASLGMREAMDEEMLDEDETEVEDDAEEEEEDYSEDEE